MHFESIEKDNIVMFDATGIYQSSKGSKYSNNFI
jgi:hypothetical protein